MAHRRVHRQAWRALAPAALLLLGGLLVLLAPAAQAAHPGWVLSGDADLAAHAHAGSGTASDPYRIRGLVLSAAQGHGIVVQGTRAHLVLEGVAVSSGGASYDGVRLVDVRNVTVLDSVLEGDRVGIAVVDSRDVVVQRTTVKTSRVGVLLERSTGVQLLENRLSVNDKDVSLVASEGNRFRENNLTTATGQFGFFFEDDRSYRNEIGTTNVVNFLPVHWYVDPCPARVEGIAMELKGVTNVAQVMLHGCRGTVVDGVRAKDGAGAGIHVLGGDNVTLRRATVEGNAGPGILLDGGAWGQVVNATVRANGAGVRVKDHDRASVAASIVEANRAEGILATGGSEALLVHEVHVRQNGGRGVAVEGSARPVVTGSNVTGNRAAGVLFAFSPGGAVLGSVVQDNAGPGVHLVSGRGQVEGNAIRGHPQQVRLFDAAGSSLESNNLTLRAGDVGLHFDDEASYAVRAAPTNLVNGVPLRWYHNLTGAPGAPVRLSGFTVAVPGVTNVAQVMVHGSRHVVLEDVNASLGLADGILVHGSEDVLVSVSTAWRNGRDGLRAHLGSDVRVQEATAKENRDDGFSFESSPLASVESSRAHGNGARGVFVDNSPLATLRGVGATGNGGAGILVARSAPGPAHVENNVVQSNAGGGILVHASNLSVLRSNLVTDNGPDGVHLLGVPPGAVLVKNDVRNHARGIHLAGTWGVELRNNRVDIARDQTGLFFADEVSYDNLIDPTNLVNDVPVRWYNEVKGTAGAPLLLEGLRVELRGITNVAQVLLREVENVTLRDAVAANGTHRGVLVLRSANVTFLSSRVENNTLDGLRVDASKDLFVHGVQVADNRGHGAHLAATDRARVDSAVLRGSGGQGLRAEGTGLVLLRATISENADAGLAALGAHRDGTRVANTTFLGNRGVGAIVSGARSALVEDSAWEGNARGGLSVEAVESAVILRNVLRDNGDFGVQVVSSRPGGLLADNLVVNHTRGVAFAGTKDWEGRSNQVHLGRGAYGFHFADELSYANLLPTSNLVNGTPLRWYADQAGPLVLSDVRVEVRGITNVAQVMLYRSADVRLESPVVANGTGHGVLLHASTNVTLAGARVENNTRDGVSAFEGGGRHAVRNATIRGNGGHGVHAVRSGANEVSGSLVEENGGAGLRFVGRAIANVASDNRVLRNAQGGIELEDPISPRVAGNVLEGNGPFGVWLARASGTARVEDNALANHTKGIRLAGTEYAEIHRNNLTILGGQTGLHFEDETSYNNAIPPTNAVNGTPVRWYAGLTGTESAPVVLRNLTVETRGITNVAQVMLYRSSYVTLEDVRATNGLARGVELYHSSSIILRNVTATGNQDGVQLKNTQSSQLLGIDVRDNVRGVKLVASGSNLVAGVDASGSEVGVLVADGDSRSNRIHGTEAARARVASVQDPSAHGLQGNNLVADAGLDRRVLVGRALRLDGGLATYRFETERIVLQRWEYGDGAAEESGEAAPFRPSHAWTQPGSYRVNLTVRTADGAILSDSAWVTVVPPLSEPRNVRAAVGDRNVTLTWEEPASDGASPIAKYVIHRAQEGGNLTRIAEVTDGRRILDTWELANGRTYLYAISAVNADGEGPRSAVVTAVPGAPPGPPRNVAARAGSGNVTLTWEPPADEGGRPVLGYRVLRGPTGLDLVPYADAGNVTSWSDAAVGNGIHYSYAVVAVNAMGAGLPSESVSAVPAPLPPAPANLRALPGDRAITLVWDQPVRPGDAPVLRYHVLRGESPTALARLGTTPTRDYRDPTAVQGVEYHYAVVAVNGVGESPVSAAVAASLQAHDRLRPLFLAKGPEPDVVHPEPPAEVWAEYLDNLGVDLATVRLRVDGVDVTRDANVSDRAVRYAPLTPFRPGPHVVKLSVADAAGNAAETEWTFHVFDPSALRPRWEWAGLNLSAPQVPLGESVLVQAFLRNAGNGSGTLEVQLLADGAPVLRKNVTLEPGKESVVAFRYKPALAGLVNVTMGGLPPLELRVVGPDAAPAAEGAPPGAMPLADEETEGEAEEEGGFFAKRLPGPAPLLGVAGAALLALRRRRGRRGA